MFVCVCAWLARAVRTGIITLKNHIVLYVTVNWFSSSRRSITSFSFSSHNSIYIYIYMWMEEEEHNV